MKRRIWLFGPIVFFVGLSFAQDRQQSAKASQWPPEKAAGQAAVKIMGYDVAPVSVDRSERDLAQKGYPTNNSLGYKGIVMANLHADTADDEIAVDFGSLGLWIYDSGSWYQISGVNPEGMIAATLGSASDDELIVDFGSLGLWRWDYNGYPGNWAQWSGVNPRAMFATDDDADGIDEVHVDFNTLGVWRLDEPDWTHLSGLTPINGLRMDAWDYGYEEGVWSFPTFGVWNIYLWGSSPFYEQLTGTVNGNDDHASAQFTSTAGAEDLVMDFGTLGIWLYKEDGSGWVQVSSMDPNRLKEVKFYGGLDYEYELLVEDNAGGLYWGDWNGGGMNWTLITTDPIGPGWCETFDKDGTDGGEEEVAIPLISGGAKIYDYSAGTLSNFVSPSYFVNFMVKGDLYEHGFDCTIVFVFGPGSVQSGVYVYDAKSGTQGFISYNVPDGIY
jgi:hypothetical protein